MNLLQAILNAGGGSAVQQVAGQFGLDQDQATSAISALLPALAGGLQNNLSQEGGLESLLGALSGGNHSRFLDDPSTLSDPSTINEGNGILGHLLGSKDVSRQVASHAAAQTGLGSDLMKQLLPVVASMAMGALSKQGSQQGFVGQAAAAPAGDSGVLGMLTPFLDMNRDGSVADDVIGMVGKLFQR